MIEKLKMLLIILCLIGLGFCIYDLIVGSRPKAYEIWDKGEYNGKCFVAVWHEVSPEEYIGLDIGDEYIIKE